jgi:hypothetical protein
MEARDASERALVRRDVDQIEQPFERYIDRWRQADVPAKGAVEEASRRAE